MKWVFSFLISCLIVLIGVSIATFGTRYEGLHTHVALTILATAAFSVLMLFIKMVIDEI